MNILLLTDFEEGHIFPTFKIAQNLIDAGFNILYLTFADRVALIREQGFEAYPIFEEVYPEGSLEEIKNNRLVNSNAPNPKHFEAIINGALDDLIDRLSPKLIITSCFISLENLLIHYQYNIPQVIYHTYLSDCSGPLAGQSLKDRQVNTCMDTFTRLAGDLPKKLLDFIIQQGGAFKNLTKIVDPLKAMPQIMLCPEAFKIHQPSLEGEHYIGPCIREATITTTELANYLPPQSGKKIIFASLGSQTKNYLEKAQTFFQFMVNSMRQETMSAYHLILSVGSTANKEQLEGIPENVSVFSWVPQAAVLQRVHLAIIHGGLGSIKECIYHGVPMIVVPMGRDQNDNATRVAHHRLGNTLSLLQVEEEGLSQTILDTLNASEIQNAIDQMKTIFRDQENRKGEIDLIKKYIQAPTPALP